MTPIQRLIEELKVDVHNTETVIKRSSLVAHQKKILLQRKQTLCEVIYNLEFNYRNIEIDFINKLKK